MSIMVREVEKYLPIYEEVKCPIPTIYFILETGKKHPVHSPYVGVKLVGLLDNVWLDSRNIYEDEGAIDYAMKSFSRFAKNVQKASNNTFIIDQTL